MRKRDKDGRSVEEGEPGSELEEDEEEEPGEKGIAEDETTVREHLDM
jgi:hypothetical protein